MLRVALVIDGPVVPAWIGRIVEEIGDCAEAVVVGVVSLDRTKRRVGGRAFRAYQAIDRRLFPIPNDPLAPSDVSARLCGAPRVAKPSEVNADLVLKLAAVESAPLWRDAAPLGVWSFDHVERSLGGAPDFFPELVRGESVYAIRLRAATPHGSRVLAQSVVATHPTSLGRSRQAAYWKAAALGGRALRNAAHGVVPEDASDAGEEVLAEQAPSLLGLGRWLATAALRLSRDRVVRRRQAETWFVGLRASRDSLVDGPMDGFAPLPMPGDRFYADPFLVRDGDRVWLFFEDADRVTQRGVIRCSELRPDGSIGDSRVVLACDTHLSYPNVFQSGGSWFMLPETHANRRVELWRALEFPWRWTRERVLLDAIPAVDPTLLEHEGRLWLFVGVAAAAHVPADELFAFSADSLHGEWVPHRRNPIVADTRHARPAGPFFREGGGLFRPTQDGSGGYGSALWIQRVEHLDPDGYAETPVRRVATGWWPGLIGTHTISRAGGFDAIDGRLWWRRGRPFPAERRGAQATGRRRD